MRLKSVLNFKMWLTGSDQKNPYSLIKELLSKDSGSFVFLLISTGNVGIIGYKECDFMFKIINSFRNENEGYIVVPSLRKFMKRQNISMTSTYDRDKLLESIEEYASVDNLKEEIVLCWLDDILKEGTKDVNIFNYEIDERYLAILNDDKQLLKYLEDDLFKGESFHLNDGGFDCELKLLTYKVSISEKDGRIISLYFGRKVYISEKENGRVVHYPVFADIYVQQQMIVVRAKPKVNMYEYKEQDFKFEEAKKLSAEGMIQETAKFVYEKFELEGLKDSKDILKEKLYLMLNLYTQTPEEIVNLMIQQEGTIAAHVENVLQSCKLNKAIYEKDVSFDVMNMFEKYFSINYPDKSIFTQNRIAYPLRIIATDDEESKVDQIAGAEEPLQSKAIFFDNKKMLQKTKSCEGIVFKYKRQEPLYFGKEFLIKIQVKKDSCYMKFTQYTAEEDIINVIFSLINAG